MRRLLFLVALNLPSALIAQDKAHPIPVPIDEFAISAMFTCFQSLQPNGDNLTWVGIGLDYGQDVKIVEYQVMSAGQLTQKTIVNSINEINFFQRGALKGWMIKASGVDGAMINIDLEINNTPGSPATSSFVIRDGKSTFVGNSCGSVPRLKRNMKDVK